jgi:flagellar hook-length control protein FliK
VLFRSQASAAQTGAGTLSVTVEDAPVAPSQGTLSSLLMAQDAQLEQVTRPANADIRDTTTPIATKQDQAALVQPSAADATGGMTLTSNAVTQGAQVQRAELSFAAMMAVGDQGQAAADVAPATTTVQPLEATTPVGHVGPTSAATPMAEVRHAHAAEAAQRAQMPQIPATEQVAVHIAKAAEDGVDRISVQLSPESLGRIEVKLEIQDGRVQAVVAVDRQETLDALRRDQQGLERALQEAGLKTDGGSLSFNLRSQDGGDARRELAQGDQRGERGHGRNGQVADGTSADAPAPTRSARRGLDISV